jgi:hypothetical protein
MDDDVVVTAEGTNRTVMKINEIQVKNKNICSNEIIIVL